MGIWQFFPQSKLHLDNVDCYTMSSLLFMSWIIGLTSPPRQEHGRRSGESTQLPPMFPGSDSWTRRHVWFEFVVGSGPCSKTFSSGYSSSPLSSDTNISNSSLIRILRTTGLSIVTLVKWSWLIDFIHVFTEAIFPGDRLVLLALLPRKKKKRLLIIKIKLCAVRMRNAIPWNPFTGILKLNNYCIQAARKKNCYVIDIFPEKRLLVYLI